MLARDQLYGRATVIASAEPQFRAIAAPLSERAGPAFPIRAAIVVVPDRVERIVAPSIWMYPDIPAAQRRAGTLRAYGVVDRDPV